MEGVTVGKIVGLFVVLLANLLSSLIPLRIAHHGKAKESSGCKTVVEFCHSIGGGIFLGTCFIGLFPFVKEKLSTVSGFARYPIAEALLILGFFIVVAVEQLITKCSKRHGNAASRQVSDTAAAPLCHDHQAHDENSEDELFLRPTAAASGGARSPVQDPYASHSGDTCHGSAMDDVADRKTSLLRSAFLVSAIGLHGTFEGIAVGLQAELATLVNLLISVVIHESLCSFATGVSLSRQRLSTAAVVKLCVAFSLMLPAGIVLGIFLSEIHGKAGDVLSGILQGIANGTFLYVLFIEITPVILHMPSRRGLHVLSMFLGSVAMAALATVVHHHHSPGGGGCHDPQLVSGSALHMMEAGNSTSAARH